MLECPLWHPGLLYATVDIDRQRIPRHYGLILTYSWRMGADNINKHHLHTHTNCQIV